MGGRLSRQVFFYSHALYANTSCPLVVDRPEDQEETLLVKVVTRPVILALTDEVQESKKVFEDNFDLGKQKKVKKEPYSSITLSPEDNKTPPLTMTEQIFQNKLEFQKRQKLFKQFYGVD